MAIRSSIWKIGEKPEELLETVISSEQLLEKMIIAAPRILSEEWMLIGSQEDTGHGGRIDLLAVAPDGTLVLIELKRSRTPREVVAQALDYATWVAALDAAEIQKVYDRFRPGADLAADFLERFGEPLEEESLNANHQIIIVAASLDPSTERIVNYLSERDIPINVLCFQVFASGGEKFLSRAWLRDPAETQENVTESQTKGKEPWNGEFYCSFGPPSERDWGEAVQYGFMSAGGSVWASGTLQFLKPGDRIWVNIPAVGYVGVGRVTGRPIAAREFRVVEGGKEVPVMEVLKKANYHRNYFSDLEKCENFVPVTWLQTVSVENAVKVLGQFGNQNSVCRPTAQRWRMTIERLKERFPKYEG